MAEVFIMDKTSRDANEYTTQAIKIPDKAKSILFGIESDTADWESGGVDVNLSVELSEDGQLWRDYHGCGVNTSKATPKARPEMSWNIDKKYIGWFVRGKLSTNKRMKIGLVMEIV